MIENEVSILAERCGLRLVRVQVGEESRLLLLRGRGHPRNRLYQETVNDLDALGKTQQQIAAALDVHREQISKMLASVPQDVSTILSDGRRRRRRTNKVR